MCQNRTAVAAGMRRDERHLLRAVSISGTPPVSLVLLFGISLLVPLTPSAQAVTAQGAQGAQAVMGIDSDGDGVANIDDVDDDNDGIFDRDEGLNDADRDGVPDPSSSDVDGDGIPDGLDLDSDGDGIPDNVESRVDLRSVRALDRNLDGVIDADVPLGRNGIADVLESTPDSNRRRFKRADVDRDGVPDFRDVDTDDDGIEDRIEAGSQGSTPLDTDSDGIPDFRDLDSDGDGVPDSDSLPDDDAPVGVPGVEVPDRDGDGVPDALDLDDDNDGLLDTDEQLVDADGDGLADAGSRDSDDDGVPDGNDSDSDNDGLTDLSEGLADADVAIALDQDGDGVIDAGRGVGANGLADELESEPDSGQSAAPPVDTDNDGVPDFIDTDSDNDTIADGIEAGASGRPLDTDGDGIGDHRETDADGDGIGDHIEVGSEPARPADSDGNGQADFQEADVMNGSSVDEVSAPPADADADSIPNATDQDADGDGIPDALEAGFDSDGDGVDNRFDLDSDNDGINDATEAFGGEPPGPSPLDSDGDGVYDYVDLDSDNDSVFDAYESDYLQVTSDGRLAAATTVDARGLASGVADDPTDSDGDAVPDYRDLDSDNDGLIDLAELGGVDLDGDARIDGFDDAGRDGADDDIQKFVAAWIDTDGDSIPDMRDLDSDNDGLPDIFEAHGAEADTDADGRLDTFVDQNGDGLDDTVAALGTHVLDSDMDGLPDQTDADSDNDGIYDLTEAGGADADGDGMIDDGMNVGADGFGGPFVGNPEGLAAIPDSDGDGINDVQDALIVQGAQAPEDDPLMEVDERSDSRGSGCSVARSAVTDAGKVDPGLLLLLFTSLALAMKRRRSRVAIAVTTASALALAGCSATSEPGATDFDGRFYVGGGLLASQLEPDASDDDRLTIDEDQSGGGSVLLGYDISNRFTLEGHVSALGEAAFEPDGEIAYQVGGLSALLYGLNHEDDRSLREGFSAFARLGAGTMQNQADDIEYERINDVHLLGGAGVEYGFSNGLAMRGEFVAHDTDARYAQLALLYRFGDVHDSAFAVIEAEAEAKAEADAAMADDAANDDMAADADSAVDDAASAVTTPVPTAPAPSGRESLDADGDGVVDARDDCPDTSDGALVDRSGCVALDGVLEGVKFESGSDALTPKARRELNRVLQVLTANPSVVAVIAAHTDNQGSARSNLELSGRRALRVARYLADRGIAPQRLKPKAYGESRPLAVNSTAAGREQNRRVEMTVAE